MNFESAIGTPSVFVGGFIAMKTIETENRVNVHKQASDEYGSVFRTRLSKDFSCGTWGYDAFFSKPETSIGSMDFEGIGLL